METIEEHGKFKMQYMVESSSKKSLQNVLLGIAHIDLHAMTANSHWSTNPVMSMEYSFVYKSPEFLVLQTFFLDVFTPQFWFASLGITFLIVFVGWVFNRSKALKEDKTSMLLLSVFVLTSAVRLPPTKRSTFRFFLVVAGLFSFMFVSAFNLFLTSFLSTQTTILPFKTVDDIAADGTYSLCINPNSALSTKFYDKKWKNIVNNKACPKKDQYSFGKGLHTIKYACKDKIVVGTAGVSKE